MPQDFSQVGTTAVGLGDIYASVADFKAWLTDKVDYVEDADGASIDDLLTDCLTTGSRDCDGDTGRIFYRVDDEIRQTFVQRGGEVEFVDLIVDADSGAPVIIIDTNGDDVPDRTLASTDYTLLPRTGPDGRLTDRYTSLRPTATGNLRALLHPGYMVQITGSWGYLEGGAAPAQIKTATLLRAARYLARRDARLGSLIVAWGGGSVQTVTKLDADYDRLVSGFALEGYGIS